MIQPKITNIIVFVYVSVIMYAYVGLTSPLFFRADLSPQLCESQSSSLLHAKLLALLEIRGLR